jgi:hypothetical protein
MVLLPTVSWLPLTINIACAVPAVPVKATEPSSVLPRSKATVPVGVPLPLAAVTVAVKVVDAVGAMVLGLAATVVVVGIVATNGAMLVTSLAVADAEPPPETVTWLVTCEAAFDATFAVTVIAG